MVKQGERCRVHLREESPAVIVEGVGSTVAVAILIWKLNGKWRHFKIKEAKFWQLKEAKFWQRNVRNYYNLIKL